MNSGLSAGSNAFGSEFSAVNCSSPTAATFPDPSALTSFEGWINEPTRTRRTFQSTSSKLLRAKPQDFSLTSVTTADSSSHGVPHRSLVDSQATATRSQLSPTPTPGTSLPQSSPPSGGTSRLRVPSGFVCPLTGRIMRDPVIPVPLFLTQPQLLPHAGPSNASPPSPLRATAAIQSPVQQKQLSAQHELPAAAALAPEVLAARYRLPPVAGTSGWYERAAISSWLTGQSRNQTLSPPQIQLVANVSLRMAIQDWLKQHGLDYAAADQLLLSLQLEREEPCGQGREGEAEGEDHEVATRQCGIHSGKVGGLPNGEAGPGIGPGISSGTIHVLAHAVAVAAIAAVATAPAPVLVPVPARERIRHTAYGFDVAAAAAAPGVAAAPSDAATVAAATVTPQVPAAHGQRAASLAASFAAAMSAAPSKPPSTPAGVGVGAMWTWASSRSYEFRSSSSVSSSWGSGGALGGGGSWRWRTAGRPPPAPTATITGWSPALAGTAQGLESWGGSRIGGAAAIYGVRTEASMPTPLASGVTPPAIAAAAGWTLATGEVRRGSPEGRPFTARLPQLPLSVPDVLLHSTYSDLAAMGGSSAFDGSQGPAAAAKSCTVTAAPQQTSTGFANAAASTTATVMAAAMAAGLTQAPGGEALAHTEFEAAIASAGLLPGQFPGLKPPVPRRSGGVRDGGGGCRSWHWHGASLYQQHALPRQRSGSPAAAALAPAFNGGSGSSSLCVESLLAGPLVAEGEAERLYHRSLSAPVSSPPLLAPRQGLPPPVSIDTQQLLRPQQQQPQQGYSSQPQQLYHYRQHPPPMPQPQHRLSQEWSAGTGSAAAAAAVATRGGLIQNPLGWVGADAADQLTSAGEGAVDCRFPEPRCAQPLRPLLPTPLPQPQLQYPNQQHLAQPGQTGRVCAEPLLSLLPQQQELCHVRGLERYLEAEQPAEQKIPDPEYAVDSRCSLTSVPRNLSSTSEPNAAQWDTGDGDKRHIWRRLLSGGSGAMRALLNSLQGQLAGLRSRGTGAFLTGWSDPWGSDDHTGTCGADALAAVAVPSASDSEAMVSARDGCFDSDDGGASDSYQSGKGSSDRASAACGGNSVMNGTGGAGGSGRGGGEGGPRAESSYLAMRCQAAPCASLAQVKVGNRARVGRALSGCRKGSGGVGETAGDGGEASIGGRWWRRMAANGWRHPAVPIAETEGLASAENLDLDVRNRVCGKGREHEVEWQKPGYQWADGESGGDDGIPPSLQLQLGQRPPPPPGSSELPLELPLPLQWLTADQLADCGLNPRDEVQAAEHQRQRVWRWLRGVPPPACRDLLTLLRCTTLAPQARPTTTAAPTTSSSMAPGMGRGLAAAPLQATLRCVPVGSHLPHRITALAVLPPPPGPPALAYSLAQFRTDPLAGDDGASTPPAPSGDGGAAAAGGIPPATSPPTRGSFAILVTRDRPGHVLVEELPSAGPATAAVQGPAGASGQGQSQPAEDAAAGRSGRCWMVPAVRGRVTVVAACPRGGSLAIGTSAGLVFVWRCFPAESLRALQDVREMEVREQPTAAAVEAAAAAASKDTAVEGWSRRPGSSSSSSYAYLPRRGSSDPPSPLLEWQLCGRLGWPQEAAIGGGGGGGGGGSSDADCSVTALGYDGTGATLFAACRGVVEGWKLRHFEQPERIPSVVTAAFLFLTPEDYGYDYCNTPNDGAVSTSSWFGRRSCGSSGTGGGGTSGRPDDDTLGSRPNALPFTSYHNDTLADVIMCNGSGVRFSSSGGGGSDNGGLPSALDLGPTAWRRLAMEEEEEEAAVSVAAAALRRDGAGTASLSLTSSTALPLPLPSSAATAGAAVFTAAAPAMASYGTLSSLATGSLQNTASTLSFRFSSAPSDFPSATSSAPLPCWPGKHALSTSASARNYPTVCCLAASPSGAHLALALSDGAVHLALHADCPCRTVCVRLLPPLTQSVLADMDQPFPGWATQMAFSGDERRLLVLVLGVGPTRSHRRGRGGGPSRAAHPLQRRDGASDKEFNWGAGGGGSGGGGCDSQQRASSAKASVGVKAEEGEEDDVEAAEVRYSLHCFPLTQQEEKEEEEEGEMEEEEGADTEGEFSGAAGSAEAAGLTRRRRGVGGAVHSRTGVPGTCVYAALDSDDTDDDEDDAWVHEVCILDQDVDEDHDNGMEAYSDDNIHDEGKDDTGPAVVVDGYRREDEQGWDCVLEELKKETFRASHATVLQSDGRGAPRGKGGFLPCAEAAKDAVAGLQHQPQPLAFPVSAREQCLETSRNIIGGVYCRHQRQLHCVEAPSDVVASHAAGGGSSDASNRRSRSRHRRQRRNCNIPHTTGLGGGGGEGEGSDGTGGRGGGGGGCHSEVVLSSLRVPPQSASWRARLTNLVVATDGTSALLLDSSPADVHPGEPGSYCNDNCNCNCNCNCQQQSSQQILLKLQEAQRDQHQSSKIRKYKPRKQRQQLLFVDMTTGRARRLPLELHPCDRNHCYPHHRHHHHYNYQQHQQHQHQHQQPLPARAVARWGSGGGAAGGPCAVVDNRSVAPGTADNAAMKQNKQRRCCSCCSCSCMALLPGGRELLVGGDCGLFRWTFGA